MEGCRNYKSEELWAVTKSSSRSGCRRKAYMEVAKPKHTLRHSRGMPPKTLSVFGNGLHCYSNNLLLCPFMVLYCLFCESCHSQ
jgi:hypothetical protein